MNDALNPAAPTREVSCPKLQTLLEYLDSLHERADLDTLRRLLVELEIVSDDLSAACIFKECGYQRNMIKQSPWYEAVCLCWSSGQRTPIHDHAGSSCAFLVVNGIATETRFDQTPSGLVIPTWTKYHEPGYVCASDEADIHQVANTQPEGHDLVTLHIYSPQLRGFNIHTLDTPTASSPGTVKRATFPAE